MAMVATPRRYFLCLSMHTAAFLSLVLTLFANHLHMNCSVAGLGGVILQATFRITNTRFSVDCGSWTAPKEACGLVKEIFPFMNQGKVSLIYAKETLCEPAKLELLPQKVHREVCEAVTASFWYGACLVALVLVDVWVVVLTAVLRCWFIRTQQVWLQAVANKFDAVFGIVLLLVGTVYGIIISYHCWKEDASEHIILGMSSGSPLGFGWYSLMLAGFFQLAAVGLGLLLLPSAGGEEREKPWPFLKYARDIEMTDLAAAQPGMSGPPVPGEPAAPSVGDAQAAALDALATASSSLHRALRAGAADSRALAAPSLAARAPGATAVAGCLPTAHPAGQLCMGAGQMFPPAGVTFIQVGPAPASPAPVPLLMQPVASQPVHGPLPVAAVAPLAAQASAHGAVIYLAKA